MSGRITIDNLSDSLKDMISNGGLSEEQVLNLINENGLSEEQVLNLINENGLSEEQVLNLVKNNLTGDISQLSTQEKGSLVGAINELFQSANNGKELIANAIGEPLNAEDTFSAMSNDINGLLSTFKTNMMNNGVTVNGSDKFKALIDKIATLADSEGSGIQFASGTYTTSGGKTYLSTTNIIVPMNLSFDPTYVFVESSFVAYDTSYEYRPRTLGLISNIRKLSLDRNSEDSNNDTQYSEIYLTNITRSSCKIDGNGSGITVDAGTYNWYAIGVGEEDTTLRDSLASILQGEGVSVTKDDDMASLISKVDSEFDRQVVPAGTAVASNVDNGKTFINSTGQVITGTSNKVSPAGTAVASNVLSGKTFINTTGQTITGTMVNRGGAQTVTPGTSNKTLNAGYYSGNITVQGDSNLVAANIVSGKSIFGVSGTAKSVDNLNAVDIQVYQTNTTETTWGSGIGSTEIAYLPQSAVPYTGSYTVMIQCSQSHTYEIGNTIAVDLGSGTGKNVTIKNVKLNQGDRLFVYATATNNGGSYTHKITLYVTAYM